jgi:hypothetical protein
MDPRRRATDLLWRRAVGRQKSEGLVLAAVGFGMTAFDVRFRLGAAIHQGLSTLPWYTAGVVKFRLATTGSSLNGCEITLYQQRMSPVTFVCTSCTRQMEVTR